MQELTTEVKAEMRAVLQHYGITQFKIRPVRRNYAFEQPGVAHTMQWVLKVTYPASMPQLPLGLSGTPLQCSPRHVIVYMTHNEHAEQHSNRGPA